MEAHQMTTAIVPLCQCGSAFPVLGASTEAVQGVLEVPEGPEMHQRVGAGTPADESCLSWVFEKAIRIMVSFFVCYGMNSMAQSYAQCQEPAAAEVLLIQNLVKTTRTEKSSKSSTRSEFTGNKALSTKLPLPPSLSLVLQ
ncbi:hypothetical protein DPEC_G00225580 [Dallia pectoralis]|uniref:Uncharacterized protein n=1 Tax=Dallia pectoralis TaxID=75939 RepID=A0ACC2G0S5_DALPE|nr:hypothetical protein DPEC_G00225580 [Dallia pectoralis]